MDSYPSTHTYIKNNHKHNPSLHFTRSGRIHQSKPSRGPLQTPAILSTRLAGTREFRKKSEPTHFAVSHQNQQARLHSLSSHWPQKSYCKASNISWSCLSSPPRGACPDFLFPPVANKALSRESSTGSKLA